MGLFDQIKSTFKTPKAQCSAAAAIFPPAGLVVCAKEVSQKTNAIEEAKSSHTDKLVAPSKSTFSSESERLEAMSALLQFKPSIGLSCGLMSEAKDKKDCEKTLRKIDDYQRGKE